MRLRSKRMDEVSVGYRPKPTFNKSSFILVFAVLLAGASFYEGTAFQRNADTTGSSPLASVTTTPPVQSYGLAQGNGMKTGSFVRNHIIGQVAAVSSNSITIQDQNTGQNTTLNITSSTQIDVNGQSATTGDIQSGNLVIATKASSASTQATKIIVAPGTWNNAGIQQPATSPLPGLSSN